MRWPVPPGGRDGGRWVSWRGGVDDTGQWGEARLKASWGALVAPPWAGQSVASSSRARASPARRRPLAVV